jgi:mono/diheme cytochrome c family protein
VPPTEPDYVTEFPVDVTEARMQRGQAKFNIYCAPCHGLVGQGDGLISLRALSLQEPTWVPPTNLTNDVVAAQPVGKLYDTITNGRRKMAGYAAQIEPDDRWSIVLYVRALQRSQRATLKEVPKDEATILNNRK